MLALRFVVPVTCLLAAQSFAQIGGSGRDGPFTPTSNVTLDTSRNGGVYEYTLIKIPMNVEVKASGPNPLILRSRASVEIHGTLSCDGEFNFSSGGAGGPGGYDGGNGGRRPGFAGIRGSGPGGGFGASLDPKMDFKSGGGAGHATDGRIGVQCYTSANPGWQYGSAFPFDLRGGSGGGGASTRNFAGMPGSGGGGVCVILADGDIVVSGTITASGANVKAIASCWAWGGAGAGGSIMLRSLKSVRLVSSGRVLAIGGVLDRFPSSPIVSGADGYVRIDAYGETPELQGVVRPAPTVLRLPYLRDSVPPKLGKTWRITAAAVPGDVIAMWVSTRSANVMLPPFGTLRIDLQFSFLLGAVRLPATGIDTQAAITCPVPRDTRLAGLRLYVQGMHAVASTRRPRLTNGYLAIIGK